MENYMMPPTWKMWWGILLNEHAIFQHLAKVDLSCFHNYEKPKQKERPFA